MNIIAEKKKQEWLTSTNLHPSNLFNHTFKLNIVHTPTTFDFIDATFLSPCLSFLFFFHIPTIFMEFAYRDGQNQRTPLPTLCPISTPAYVSEHPLQGNPIFSLLSFQGRPIYFFVLKKNFSHMSSFYSPSTL